MGVKEDNGEIVNAWPENLNMRCYTQKEIHKLSVKEITSVLVSNRDGEIEAEGLHDPAMGPNSRGERCTTCNQRERFCPGHCGHIDLAKPCLNPLFYNELKQLIVSTCYECGQVKYASFSLFSYLFSFYAKKTSNDSLKLAWKP